MARKRSLADFQTPDPERAGQHSEPWNGPPIGTKCRRCRGRVTDERVITGGYLPVATRVGSGWDVRMHACPDCAIGAWRARAQRVRFYTKAPHAPQGLGIRELHTLHRYLGGSRNPGTLTEAAERIPVIHNFRDAVIAACQRVATYEANWRETPEPDRTEDLEPAEELF